MQMKTLIAGVAMALALPFAASAATVSGSINDYFTLDEGGFEVQGTGVADATLSLGPSPAEFTTTASVGGKAGFGAFEYVQNYTNDSGVDTVIAISTLNTSGDFDPISYEYSVNGGGYTAFTAPGTATLMITNGSSFSIRVAGNAVSGGQFDYSISAVPVPAAGLLLLGGLGGLAALKRRKKA